MRLISCFLEFILPTSCLYCFSAVKESSVPFFCVDCWGDFAVLQAPLCPRCGRPFDSPETIVHSPDHECGLCRQRPPRFDQALSVGYFEGSLRQAIHQFKYRPCKALGEPLGAWMTSNVRELSGVDIIMPVPLHPARLKQRGFNQALILAHPLSIANKVSLNYDNLCRIKPTRPQVELSGDDRIRNVRGAFALKRPMEVEERTILLIDDVFTTGATLNECAAILKKSGAGTVSALTLARAL